LLRVSSRLFYRPLRHILIFSLVYIRKLVTIPAKSFQISVGEDEPPVGGVHIARVKLQNNASTGISNGELHVRNLDPPNNGYKDFRLDDRIAIGHRNHIFINVASYEEGGELLRLLIPSNGFSEPETFGNLPARSHKFHLRFSSLDDSDEIYCRLFVSPNKVLHLEEL
jgi:hypothetical protein